MGVPALGAGISCDFKTESSGPEIVGKFALLTTLPTRFKVKGISRYNSRVRNSHVSLKKFCKSNFCIKILNADIFRIKWVPSSELLGKVTLWECSASQGWLFNFPQCLVLNID